MCPTERFIAEMDALDQDLGLHLLRIADGPGPISPARAREAILVWCRSHEVVQRHCEDLIRGTAMAAETMADETLAYLVNRTDNADRSRPDTDTRVTSPEGWLPDPSAESPSTGLRARAPRSSRNSVSYGIDNMDIWVLDEGHLRRADNRP
jgi:hypothetical protein